MKETLERMTRKVKDTIQSNGTHSTSPADQSSGAPATVRQGGCVAGASPSSSSWSSTILIVLALMALTSLFFAVKGALASGLDFQWSGAHLLVMGQDPWLTFLRGDPGHQIIPGQNPNYLAELYVLFYPLGMMSLSRALVCWCVVNLVLLSCILFMVSRLFHLERAHSILLALLTLSSTPFRAALMNGQATFFILFMLTGFYYFENLLLRGGALGLSYAKYSFSPLLVLVQAFKGRFLVLIVSAVPPLCGLLIVKVILGEGFTMLALEPLKTSKVAVAPGWGDLMTLLERLMQWAGAPAGTMYLIPVLAGLGTAVIAAFFIARIKNLKPGAEFALILAFTLVCFQHLVYDYVVFLVPMAALLASPKSVPRTIAFWCAAYIAFGTSVINHMRFVGPLLWCACSFGVVLTFALCLTKVMVQMPARLKAS